MFEVDKKNAITKQDKSKKGDIDKEIQPLITFFNEHPDYYTTSSCSGRIVLLSKDSEKKQNANWLFVSHELIDKLPKITQSAWLRMEPFILHVCCRSLDHATQLLNICEKLGLKRSGIRTLNKRIMMEIIGTDHIVHLLEEDSSNEIVLKECNKKLERNLLKLNQFYEECKTHL